MEKSNILVSAIISTYNSEKFIRNKLDDLLNQTIVDKLEIVIVNSGSRQNEDSIIKEYLEKYSNIKYIKTEQRETIYKAWNRGIKISSGEFITNANTDDRLRKDAYEIFVNYMQDNSDVFLVYADQFISNIPNENYELNNYKFRRRTFRPKFSRLKLLYGYMAGSQSFWRSSLHFKDNFWFNENYEVAGDYDFICRIAEKYKIKKIQRTIGVFYKAKDKSNKEDQNIHETLNEAVIIKELYANRYINSLTDSEVNRLVKKLELLLVVPGIFWGILNIISEKIVHGYFFPDKIFFCWLRSIISESKGEFEKALRIVNTLDSKSSSQLIKNQITKLKKIFN